MDLFYEVDSLLVGPLHLCVEYDESPAYWEMLHYVLLEVATIFNEACQ